MSLILETSTRPCPRIATVVCLQRTDRNMPADHNLARDNREEFARRLAEKLNEVLREHTKNQKLQNLQLEVSDLRPPITEGQG